MHLYKTEQHLPVTKSEAWEFFSSPKNLSLITPPEMDFRILSAIDKPDLFEGMKIDYAVRPLFGISLNWQTEIGRVENQKCFIDRQSKGPYKFWEHTHTFVELKDGILMQDHVKYELPFGVIGRALNYLLIQRKIKTIFDYRRKVLKNIFMQDEYYLH